MSEPGDAKRPRTGALHVGTSGWHYESWLGPFYPAGLPKPRLLATTT